LAKVVVKYTRNCKQCGAGFWTESKETHEYMKDSPCPICQRKELLRAREAGAKLRFPTTLSEPDRYYLESMKRANE
jgi:hypothetical protein